MPHDYSQDIDLVNLRKLQFTSPEEQLLRVRQRNKERGWGFYDKDFHELGEPPALPPVRRTLSGMPFRHLATVLCIYLPDKGSVAGVQRTWDELTHWAWEEQASRAKKPRPATEVLSDPDHLRLRPGLVHQPGLRWGVIDIQGNTYEEPCEIALRPEAPHAALLAACALHPQWVSIMNVAGNPPMVFFTGYQTVPPGSTERDFCCIPMLSTMIRGRPYGHDFVLFLLHLGTGGSPKASPTLLTDAEIAAEWETYRAWRADKERFARSRLR